MEPSEISPTKSHRTHEPGTTSDATIIHPGDNEGQLLDVSESEVTDWPAPRSQLAAARNFIKDCIKGRHLVLLVPDKDGTHNPP